MIKMTKEEKTYWLDTIEEAGTKASYAIDYDNEAQRENRKWFFISVLKEALLKQGYKPKEIMYKK